MRKILGLTMLTLFFTCCEVTTRTSTASDIVTDDFPFKISEVREQKLMKDDIEYFIYYQYEGGLHVVNHTKELLEVELLQLQLDSLKK